MLSFAGATNPGRSPFGMSVFQQIEEEGVGGEWVGETEGGRVQSPPGRTLLCKLY